MRLKSIIISGELLFVVLGLTAVFLFSLLTLIAVLISSSLAGYLLFLAFYRRYPKRQGHHVPSVLLTAFTLVPFSLAGVIALEGILGWQTVLLGVISYGLLITFWVNLTTVPLAIRSKYEEKTFALNGMTYPSLSVIVPAYNEEKVIGSTIESILESDYPYKQVIVVDDGSTDSTY